MSGNGKDHPAIVCPECGALNAAAMDTIGAFESNLVRAERTIKALRGQLNDRRLSHKKRAEALEVYEHWKETIMPGSRAVGDARFDATAARLNDGYTVGELKWAIDGYAAFPRMNGPERVRKDGEPRDDLELICRDEKHVRDGMKLAVRDMGDWLGYLRGIVERSIPQPSEELLARRRDLMEQHEAWIKIRQGP